MSKQYCEKDNADMHASSHFTQSKKCDSLLLLHSSFSSSSSGEPGSAVERREGASQAAGGGGEGADPEAYGGPGRQQGEVTTSLLAQSS